MSLLIWHVSDYQLIYLCCISALKQSWHQENLHKADNCANYFNFVFKIIQKVFVHLTVTIICVLLYFCGISLVI